MLFDRQYWTVEVNREIVKILQAMVKCHRRQNLPKYYHMNILSVGEVLKTSNVEIKAKMHSFLEDFTSFNHEH